MIYLSPMTEQRKELPGAPYTDECFSHKASGSLRPPGLDSDIASRTKIGITGVCGKLVKRHPICSTVPRFLESQRTYL
jgi:hypothetical protein